MKSIQSVKEPLSPVLSDVVHRLVQSYRPEQIYLFGSAARVDFQQDSDLDLMVIVEDNALPERRKCRLAYQVLPSTGVAADILVWTKRSFEERLHLKASLPSTIMREGKLIYAS